MAQPYQSEIVYTTEMASGSVNGWLSGAAAAQHTAAWSGSQDTYYSVYIMMSGAAAPASVKFADMLARPIPLATLVIPSTTTTASVNQIGPGISGVNVANAVGFFNMVGPLKPAVWVDPGAGASWFRIVVVGR